MEDSSLCQKLARTLQIGRNPILKMCKLSLREIIGLLRTSG